MRLFLILVLGFFCASCSSVDNGMDNTVEFCKTIWGSSTRVLEEQRANGISYTYNQPYWDCVRKSMKAIKKLKWTIFQKDEIKGFIVVMGIPGNVDTTEVGIFYDELSDNQTRIQISSLSTPAKRKVAKGLFHQLDIAFGYIPPDPVVKKLPVKKLDQDQDQTQDQSETQDQDQTQNQDQDQTQNEDQDQDQSNADS